MPSWSLVLTTALLVALGRLAFLIRRLQRKTAPLTIPSTFFILSIPWRYLTPHIPFLNPKALTDWSTRFARYDRLGATVTKTTTLWTGKSTVWLAEPRAVKVVSIDRRSWSKPTEMYEILEMFGSNLVTLEGAAWKAHRRVVGPSFSEPVYTGVADTTAAVVREMMESESWDKLASGEEVEVEDMVKLTMRLTLVIISREAFGIAMPWDESKRPMARAEGHTFSTSEALGIVSNEVFLRLLTPKWMYRFPIARLQRIDQAFKELDAHLLALVKARRAALASGSDEGKADLFGSLLLAGKDEDGEEVLSGEKVGGPAGSGVGKEAGAIEGLTDREVLGNTFIFLLAGHETSGHTLAFVFALLALHPEEQQKLHDHVVSVLPDGQEPTYADFGKLTRSLAVLYETLRLFPSVVVIPKRATRRTTLPYSVRGPTGEWEQSRLEVPEGTEVYIDTAGLHANPDYWEDPLEFQPERFLGPYDRDAFVPFSAGPRACVGRRFAEVTSVLLISLLVRSFEFSAVPRMGETAEAMRLRLLQASSTLTLTPKDVDLRLRKR